MIHISISEPSARYSLSFIERRYSFEQKTVLFPPSPQYSVSRSAKQGQFYGIGNLMGKTWSLFLPLLEISRVTMGESLNCFLPFHSICKIVTVFPFFPFLFLFCFSWNTYNDTFKYLIFFFFCWTCNGFNNWYLSMLYVVMWLQPHICCVDLNSSKIINWEYTTKNTKSESNL